MNFVFALLLAATIRATPPDPALDAAVQTAIEQAPDLAAAHAAVEAAKRRIEPSRTLPDPFISASNRQVMLSQPVPFPGKLALAGRAASSEARELETAALGRAALAIEARVRNAWYDLLLAQSLDRLVEERRETAKQIEATTRDRYAAGLAVQQDVLRAQAELARIDELKSEQRAAIESRRAELARLVGDVEPKGDLPPVSAIPSDLVGAALMRSPEAAAAKQGIETARLRVDLAKKNFLPDFVTSVSSMREVSAGITLPIFANRRQRNQLAEAQARGTQRAAEAGAIARDVEVRTRERIARLAEANDVATLYHDKVIPLDELSLESALASYRAGKVPFVTVFDAVNALYADRASYLGRLAEAAKWRVAIDEVMP